MPARMEPSTELGLALKRYVPKGEAFCAWALNDGYTERCSACAGKGTVEERIQTEAQGWHLIERACDECSGAGEIPVEGPGIAEVCRVLLDRGFGWNELPAAFYGMSLGRWAPSVALLQSLAAAGSDDRMPVAP